MSWKIHKEARTRFAKNKSSCSPLWSNYEKTSMNLVNKYNVSLLAKAKARRKSPSCKNNCARKRSSTKTTRAKIGKKINVKFLA